MNKNVLITGASHGIGAAAALAFAQAGYNVGVNYFKDRDGAESTAVKIREIGMKAETYRADVSNCAECEAMLEKFIADFGAVDVLINNAGGALKMPEGGFAEMPMDYWDSQINLNLSSAAYCSRVAVRDMLEKKTPGRIINISSVHSLVTYVKRKTLPYCAAKAGLNMLTKSLAAEVAKHGINVNCIAPGFIMTKLSYRYTEAQMDAFKRKIPVGRLGSVEDITPMMLFLADVEKTRFITGQTFVVDGGQSIDGVLDIMLNEE
jgi:NAD(P)-dependent dehydrogenase (short-subunit alcohol dehydrogenase family)